MSRKLQGNIALFVAALIWGVAFVAQSVGMDYIGPFTYNGIRSILAGVFLIPVTMFFDARNKRSSHPEIYDEKQTLIGGIVCGILTLFATTLQQYGILYTTVGKAGFVTALYIVMVPLFGIFIGKRIKPLVWLFVFVAVCGFYLLCVNEEFKVSIGDVLVLISAVFFSLQIIAVDHYIGKNVNGIKLSCLQFLVTGIILAPVMLIFEKPDIASILSAKLTLLYSGILSGGVAYTLQIIGQERTDPTIATLIMSLESVISALSGWLLLNERMSFKEVSGCVLVFIAVIFAQLDFPKKHKGETKYAN